EEETAADGQTDPQGLQYWLRYTDPERLLKPDSEAGFSLICGKYETTVPPPEQFHHPLFRDLSIYRFIPDVPAPARTLDEFVRGIETPVLPHPVSKKNISAKIQYPVWTDETGKIAGGLFLSDSDSLRLIQQEHADKPAVLRLTLRKDLFPEVEILRSCGNPKLDMLAVRQLKARRENFEVKKLPATKYFTVIWKMPSLKTILQEKTL
ncbi:MAG: hypothetical protein J5858_13685, partial [Lentisphaeria bacterium]|nr:hypothetical protein [Lentisphaeria bacterium]